MVFIRDIVLSAIQEEHIWVKHRITRAEIEEVCLTPTLHRRGRDRSIEVYGQTDAGRYLIVFLYGGGAGSYTVASARDMTDAERRRYRQYRGV